MIGSAACGAPFHINAHRNASKHTQLPDARVALHAATVIVIGNIQTQVQAVFNAPTLAVKLEPERRTEPLGRGTGDQRDFFVLASGALPQQACHLGGEGKADVLGVSHCGADRAILIPAFVLLLGSGLRRAARPEGGNPLGERRLSFQCWPAEWADCF